MGENLGSQTGIENKKKLLLYLIDEENDWPKRCEYSQIILGYTAANQIYKTLSPDEITETEKEAFDIIKAQSSRQRKVLYETLFKEGEKGSVAAIKEYLDRTEGKVIDKKEITGKDGKELVPTLNVSLAGD